MYIAIAKVSCRHGLWLVVCVNTIAGQNSPGHVTFILLLYTVLSKNHLRKVRKARSPHIPVMFARIDLPDFMDAFLLDDCILFQKSGKATVIISDTAEKGMKIIVKVRIVHRLQMGLLVRFSSDCIPIRIAFDIVPYKTGKDTDFAEQIRMVAYRPGCLYRTHGQACHTSLFLTTAKLIFFLCLVVVYK